MRLQGKAQIPECRYGAACTRKGCVYSHPKKDKKKLVEVPNPDKVCFPYVAGVCRFGRKCQDFHPGKEECQTIAAKYSSIPCKFGEDCWMEGCLYAHPVVYDVKAPVWGQSEDHSVRQPNGLGIPVRQPKAQPAGPPTVQATGPLFATDELSGQVKYKPAAAIQSTSAQIATEMRNRNATRDTMVSGSNAQSHEDGNRKSPGGTNVFDLRGQSTQIIEPYLDEFLSRRLAKHPEGVWVITDTESCSQEQTEDGMLAVYKYLTRRGYTFDVDYNDERETDAFLVRKAPDPENAGKGGAKGDVRGNVMDERRGGAKDNERESSNIVGMGNNLKQAVNKFCPPASNNGYPVDPEQYGGYPATLGPPPAAPPPPPPRHPPPQKSKGSNKIPKA